MRRLACLLCLSALAAGCPRTETAPEPERTPDKPKRGAARRWWQPSPGGTGKAASPGTLAKGRLTTSELRKAVEGKTPPEVFGMMGRPSTTRDTPDDVNDPGYSGTWYYGNFAVDKVADKPRSVWLRFEAGRVVKVDD